MGLGTSLECIHIKIVLVSVAGKTISEEVGRIMAPYEQVPKPRSIELKNYKATKRQAKKGLYGSQLKKGKHPQIFPKRITFQKKLVVIKYMGEAAPKQFTLKDSVVAMRGLLPEIELQASELEVRSEITSVISNFGEEMSSCSRYSFEFIEANGKNLYVPGNPRGFEWSGKAIKNLAGSGQVYVRLLYDLDQSSTESDVQDDLPNQPPSRPGTTQPPSCPGTTQPPSRPGTTQPPSRPGTTQPPSRPGTTQPPSRPGTTQLLLGSRRTEVLLGSGMAKHRVQILFMCFFPIYKYVYTC